MSETLNPDFRGSDDVLLPNDWSSLTGWTDGKTDEPEAVDREKKLFDELEADFPVVFKSRGDEKPAPEIHNEWIEFQKSKGRYEGSNDLSLLDEFVHGAPLIWLPQIIGSCVCSNTFRAYVIRMMWQAVILGRAQEYFGRNQFGPQNFAFYCPFTYGEARKRANMRSGDGLWCEPMTESMMKTGVLLCSTPALVDLLKRLGAADDRDFPEPQGSAGARLYRDFGNWKYIEELRQYADFPLTESERVRTADQLWNLQQAGRPTFVCSMEAIHKVATHPDGFAIHARNPRDRWPHNMATHGCFVASDGERFFRWSNESWGERHIYNRRFDEVDRALRSGNLTMQSIGNIQSPMTAPPQV